MPEPLDIHHNLFERVARAHSAIQAQPLVKQSTPQNTTRDFLAALAEALTERGEAVSLAPDDAADDVEESSLERDAPRRQMTSHSCAAGRFSCGSFSGHGTMR